MQLVNGLRDYSLEDGPEMLVSNRSDRICRMSRTRHPPRLPFLQERSEEGQTLVERLLRVEYEADPNRPEDA